jgi:PPOX class probable F420-dependent enzyme
MIDETTDFGARAARRLRDEQVIWLTTVGGDGTPQPNPVWFLWYGASLLIFSRPNAAKLRHIAERPRVALSFNTDAGGEDVVVLTGEARIDPAPVSDAELAAYVEKYREGIASIEMTPESMLAAYSTVIRVTPTKARGF